MRATGHIWAWDQGLGWERRGKQLEQAVSGEEVAKEKEAQRKKEEGLTQIPSCPVFEYQNPIKCCQGVRGEREGVRGREENC